MRIEHNPTINVLLSYVQMRQRQDMKKIRFKFLTKSPIFFFLLMWVINCKPLPDLPEDGAATNYDPFLPKSPLVSTHVLCSPKS